ncbi:class I SAM-dependent methyltransferase [Ornithinimicrobium sp. F0845]|uniref:class I SAM-dependent methyltransferase n=1 Tax=Ornithinimicrobium sp. F0845 TaxID=2926412 RepID=UPI001FF121FD|nr:methyltransferase domain-containing protein [Ornithinimicrobium sp. F0845]MCK0114200.1 class I SAM-dependent methyltransferase [Ornithinimicrobium sp. F0845]
MSTIQAPPADTHIAPADRATDTDEPRVGEPDQATAEQVVGRLVQILNDGSIAVLAGIGHDTGLFDTMAGLPPATSEQIADAAGLDERYVREWLGGVTTAGFVEWDPAARTFALCPDHAPFLTGTGPDNLARTLCVVSMLGSAAPRITEVFRTGGGLHYADYPEFHHRQAADSGPVQDAYLVEAILPLTGEVDRLRAGIEVADLACGQGHAANLMARAFPASRFTGFDFEPEAIAAARAEAAAWGLDNVSFEVRDLAEGVGTAAFDLLTVFDGIHDQADPAGVLSHVAAALCPDGTFLMADIDASSHLENNLAIPWAGFLYTISTVHCMSVSLAQGGAGLGTVWGVELAEQMLHEAGFTSVVQHRLEQNPFDVYVVCRR